MVPSMKPDSIAGCAKVDLGEGSVYKLRQPPVVQFTVLRAAFKSDDVFDVAEEVFQSPEQTTEVSVPKAAFLTEPKVGHGLS